jgi:hypothetical protein
LFFRCFRPISYSNSNKEEWSQHVNDATTEEVPKRRKIEPVSELTTKYQDKISQRSIDQMDRIRIYEEEKNQRKKDAEDLKMAMKRRLKAERDSKAKEEREAKANEKNAKAERHAKAKEEREAKAKEEREVKSAKTLEKDAERKRKRRLVMTEAERNEERCKHAAAESRRLNEMTEEKRKAERAKQAASESHRRYSLSQDLKALEHAKDVVRKKKARKRIAADAIEAAQSREAEQRRKRQARQGLDTDERKEERAENSSARLRAIHSLSPNTRERRRIAQHDRAAEQADAYIRAIKAAEAKITLDMVDCPRPEALLRFDHCDTPGKEAIIPLLTFWEMSGLESIPYVNDIPRIVHEMKTGRQYNEPHDLRDTFTKPLMRQQPIHHKDIVKSQKDNFPDEDIPHLLDDFSDDSSCGIICAVYLAIEVQGRIALHAHGTKRVVADRSSKATANFTTFKKE